MILTLEQIRKKLKARKPFTTDTEEQRKMVLNAARYIGGPRIVTRKREKGGFDVLFVME